MVPTKQDERDWQRFSDAWPARLVRGADRLFAEYVNGEATRSDLHFAVNMADHACREGVPPIQAGKLPRWFKARLDRVLGPKRFDHLALTSPWLENMGLTHVPLKVVVGDTTGTQTNPVFVVEPTRPWLVDRTTLAKPTNANAAAGRKAFLAMLTALTDQPRRLAEAMRCHLMLQRTAVTGWKNIRLLFIPDDVQEEADFTPESFNVRTCKCHDCTVLRYRACRNDGGQMYWVKAKRQWVRSTEQLLAGGFSNV